MHEQINHSSSFLAFLGEIGFLEKSFLNPVDLFSGSVIQHIWEKIKLAKTILQGTVQGGRRRGRHKKRWEDNIKEWSGLEWSIILRKAENREKWRKLVVKSTQWCPNGQPDYGVDKIR